MAATKPAEMEFVAFVVIEDFAQFVMDCLAALSSTSIAPIATWEIPEANLWGFNSFSATDMKPIQALEEIHKRFREDKNFVLHAKLSDGLGLIFRHSPRPNGVIGTLLLSLPVVPTTTHKDLLVFMQATADLCRELLRTTNTYSVKLHSQVGGADCLPGPPLVNQDSHLVVVTDSKVQKAYDDVEAFWSAGWESQQAFGERKLLVRAMDVVCGPELLRKIIDSQWALARAAKAGKTKYSFPQPTPSELKIFNSGTRTLETVGYIPDEKVVEYSCVLGHGQHIPGWEIYQLRALARENQLDDGRELAGVRVVFLEQWAAEQECRPLLDVGCRVYYYTSDGQLQELTESNATLRYGCFDSSE